MDCNFDKMNRLNTYRMSMLLAGLILLSCARIDLFERVSAIPGQSWQSTYRPSFSFDIKDTTAPYQLFLILRHNNRYNYNNIWINIYRKRPDGQVSRVPYELLLATNEKGWLAEGMDDIYEHRIPLIPPANDSFYFNKAGIYTFTLEQIMRDDPLEHVLDVGVHIERKK